MKNNLIQYYNMTKLINLIKYQLFQTKNHVILIKIFNPMIKIKIILILKKSRHNKHKKSIF